MGMLGVAVASAGLVDHGTAWRRWIADYRTDIGQRREVVLDAHTRLLLNTRTAINVADREDGRHVRLLSGELLVQQTPGARPLVVETAEGRIRSQDGRLVVRRLELNTTLNLLNGQAKVFDAGGERSFQAARRVVLGTDSQAPLQPVQEAEVAWINGQIVADHMKLADFIDELQRYSPERLRYDTRVANLQVSGRFSLADVKGVFHWLSSTLPLRVDVVEHRWGSPSLLIRALG